MKSYLHFTPGDTLIFKSIVPTSAGAILGTCLILFLISVADRHLRAVCRGVDRRFGEHVVDLPYSFVTAAEGSGSTTRLSESAAKDAAPTGATPRFILSRELTRGVLAGLQTTLHYFLMLVIMTFNASYIVSVILGVVAGEVAFGRLHH
ncbi:Ctr copper transporter [Mycena haematopus]|nr:Ctr copper transporter [Mycena haematopus]